MKIYDKEIYIGKNRDSLVSSIVLALIILTISLVEIYLMIRSSFLSRIKEVGILRAIGARKKDIRRVFNAETFIIGLASGVLGISITILLNIPINIIINKLSGINNVSILPISGAIILILISVVLTIIAGLIPSSIASKKDPVIALRTE